MIYISVSVSRKTPSSCRYFHVEAGRNPHETGKQQGTGNWAPAFHLPSAWPSGGRGGLTGAPPGQPVPSSSCTLRRAGRGTRCWTGDNADGRRALPVRGRSPTIGSVSNQTARTRSPCQEPSREPEPGGAPEHPGHEDAGSREVSAPGGPGRGRHSPVHEVAEDGALGGRVGRLPGDDDVVPVCVAAPHVHGRAGGPCDQRVGVCGGTQDPGERPWRGDPWDPSASPTPAGTRQLLTSEDATVL